MLFRRFGVGCGAAIAAPLAALVLAFVPVVPAAQAVTVPRFSLSTSAVALAPGGSQTVLLTLASASPAGATVAVRALPAGVSVNATRTDSRHWVAVLTAAAAAPSSVRLAQVVLRVSRTERALPLAVAVVPASVSPPATTPPTTPPASGAARELLLRPDNPYQVVARGGTAVFGVTVSRSGWSGPVDLTVDEAPTGWQASFAPDPTSASTNLYVSVPATAAPGDYVIRFSGKSSTSQASSLVVAHVSDPQLVVVPYGWVVTDGSGIAQFDVDLRVFDDREPGGTALTFAGLPAGTSAVVAPTAVAGRVAVTLTVYYGTVPGTYTIELVGTKGARTTRVPVRLLVGSLGATTGSFRFATTAVPPVAGQARGWTLAASPAAWSTARGTTVAFDVTVRPTGGFADPVDVSLGLPSGWGVTFAATGTANVFRVTIAIPTAAVANQYTLVLLTQSGLLTASINLGLTVT